MKTALKMFVPFTKKDEEQRIVSGYFTSEALDSQGEVVKINAVKAAMPDYMKFGNIREMHQPSAVGKALNVAFDDRGGYMEAKIVDDAAWKKVLAGVYNGFSIGGKIVEKAEDIITSLTLSEISIVDRPANPDAVFSMVKFDSAEVKKEMDAGAATEDEAAEDEIAEIADAFYKWEMNPFMGCWCCILETHIEKGYLIVEADPDFDGDSKFYKVAFTEDETKELYTFTTPSEVDRKFIEEAGEAAEMAAGKNDDLKKQTEQVVVSEDKQTDKPVDQEGKKTEDEPKKGEEVELPVEETPNTEAAGAAEVEGEKVEDPYKMPTNEQIIKMLTEKGMPVDEKTIAIVKDQVAGQIIDRIKEDQARATLAGPELAEINKKIEEIKQVAANAGNVAMPNVPPFVYGSFTKVETPETEVEEEKKPEGEAVDTAKLDNTQDLTKITKLEGQVQGLQKLLANKESEIAELKKMAAPIKAKASFVAVERFPEAQESKEADLMKEIDATSALMKVDPNNIELIKKANDLSKAWLGRNR